MKFMMNGALTLGTLDGANVEICQFVGYDNMYVFGMDSKQVSELNASGSYSSFNIMNKDPRLSKIINTLVDGTWHENKNEFRPIVDDLLYKNDEYFVLADFDSYLSVQQQIDKDYQDKHAWAKKCLNNIANSAFFSSDRSIEQYAKNIWKLEKIYD